LRNGGMRRQVDKTATMFESLDDLYRGLAPWAEALLRAAIGLALVPHGLRNTFGFFPQTGVRSHNLAELAEQLDHDGYRPGRLWAPLISVTQLVAGPLLAIGLLTRAAAAPIVLLLIVANFERWRVGRYFWNQLGLEYTLMWTIAAFYFLVHGGGRVSLDRLIG
jgi:putative oxidoreductase